MSWLPKLNGSEKVLPVRVVTAARSRDGRGSPAARRRCRKRCNAQAGWLALSWLHVRHDRTRFARACAPPEARGMR